MVKARARLDAEAETIRAMQEGRWSRAFIDVLEARCNNRTPDHRTRTHPCAQLYPPPARPCPTSLCSRMRMA